MWQVILLNPLFKNYLLENVVNEDHIIKLELDKEENHIMENIIYNALIVRGYNVDVDVVEIRNENKKFMV